jgi:hypothetical protein
MFLWDPAQAIGEAVVMPDRVKRALWQAELSAQSRYLNEAVATLPSGSRRS